MRKLIITTCFLALSLPALLAQNALSISDKIAEVYGNNYGDTNPEAFRFLKNLLESRVEIAYTPDLKPSKYTALSSIPVMNKYNTTITGHNPNTFTPQTFNPLHYQIEFANTINDQIYWIDNTSYLLIIRHQ